MVRWALWLAGVAVMGCNLAWAGVGIGWWDEVRVGANWFNHAPTAQWLDDARAAGIKLVRLAPSKWKGEGRDYLLGDADEFKGIPAGDLRKLIEVLNWAQEREIKVVIAPLSLPGSRWQQHNDDKVDDRLWQDERYHQQAANFWRELAGALKDHPAIAGYNIINEPCPERALKVGDEAQELQAFYRERRGTPADVNLLYRRVIAAIREVDQRTPIVLDAPNYASVDAIPYLEVVNDPAVIYSVHFYEPWLFTTFRHNKGEMRYGDEVKIWGESFVLDRNWIDERLAQVAQWAQRNGVPKSRVFVGEFGCGRRVPGAGEYLRDVMQLIDARGWHWAFYAYREDGWDGLDYELGNGPPPAKYWQLEGDAREQFLRDVRKPNSIWNVLAERLGAGNRHEK